MHDSLPLNVLVIEHQKDGGPALFAERLSAAHAAVTVAGPDAGVDIPDSLEGFDALVVLGGSSGPTEDDKAPWLPQVRALLEEAVATQTPTLGICLGAQMLATVQGCTVDRIDAGPEIGLIDLELTEAGAKDPLLGILADADGKRTAPLRAVQWHWLEAKQLPAGSVPLVSSAACQNQAFRVGANAWGVQFHPEAMGQAARDWSKDDTDALAKLGYDANVDLIDPIVGAESELKNTWSKLFDRWIEIAREAKNR